MSEASQQIAVSELWQVNEDCSGEENELILAMFGKMGEHEDDRITGLEDVEGVDSDEWVC